MKPESSKMPMPPELEAWLSDQPPPERGALEETWHAAERVLPVADASYQRRKNEVWAAVASSMNESDHEDMPRPQLRLVQSRNWRWMAAAAAIALLIGIGYVLRPITIYAPNGQFAQATLPDGSTVHLNSGSSITYPAHFIGTRKVDLEGEAFFDVVTNNNTFVVETFNARTVVLGTEFSVRARREDPRPTTSVVVVSGRVSVSSKTGAHEPVVLTAGLGSVVVSADEPTDPANISVRHELAWRHGGLAFSDQPFGVIFAELERRYDIDIQAPAGIVDVPFSYYKHHPTTAKALLAEIAQAGGLRYRETANGFEVYRP